MSNVKTKKTLIPPSSNFLSSLYVPTHKLLESFANYSHSYGHVLMNLKYLNHSNYDSCHCCIVYSKMIKITSVEQLKSSHAFENFTILYQIEFCIETWDERSNKIMSKQLPLLNALMDKFSESKYLIITIYRFYEGYQYVLNTFLIKNSNRFLCVTVNWIIQIYDNRDLSNYS